MAAARGKDDPKAPRVSGAFALRPAGRCRACPAHPATAVGKLLMPRVRKRRPGEPAETDETRRDAEVIDCPVNLVRRMT